MKRTKKITKISVIIITKNSQKYLKECLESASAFDEVIIVDDFSQDATLDIARQHKSKIYQQKWLGFSRQKNFGINKAKNDWVFSLDSDEIVSPQLINEIKSMDFSTFDGYYIPRRNYYAGQWIKESGFYPDYQLRLFKKTKMQFNNLPIHEQVEPRGKIGYLQFPINHFTYESDKDYLSKVKKYGILDGDVLYRNHRRWNIFYQFGKPVKELFRRIIAQKAYKDGLKGFKIALFSAYAKWLAARRLKELENENRN